MMNYSINSISPVNQGDCKKLPFLYLALPVMDEPDFLFRTLNCISVQRYRRFKLIICINQPDSWWSDPVKSLVCRHNMESLEMLKGWEGSEMVVLDHSSKGLGWTGKRHGVGFARKAIMDYISCEAENGDIIVSIDADTCFSPDYLLSIARNFANHQKMVALSAPYYHNTTGDEAADRAILRYEIYMRHYFLNMAFIGSPYTFSALGSAMAATVWAYRSIGGMTPKLSGEDFYFLQKLRKFGHV
ncbi:MAG: glycosyltransferase family 2 protein, partial [Bacteroidota bacterium]